MTIIHWSQFTPGVAVAQPVDFQALVDAVMAAVGVWQDAVKDYQTALFTPALARAVAPKLGDEGRANAESYVATMGPVVEQKGQAAAEAAKAVVTALVELKKAGVTIPAEFNPFMEAAEAGQVEAAKTAAAPSQPGVLANLGKLLGEFQGAVAEGRGRGSRKG